MISENFKAMTQVALGQKEADLVLKNARILNVFSEEILTGDVAVTDGIIIGTGSYSGRQEVDLEGRYLVPGFLDAHLHLETTMVTPPELIGTAVSFGTTTFITDPHEAANVSGTDGIDFMLEQTEDLDANVYVMIPSCVPAAKHEDNGCILDAGQMARYLNHPRVLGLGEVMDYAAVTGGDEEMIKKLDLFRDKILDGHAPFLAGNQLTAYALAGIRTDHECSEFDYALEELRRGLHIHIREGSGARNLEAIVRGILAHNLDTSSFSFCTDDKHIEDILREGHISYNIKKSIALGLDPVKAYKMATIQTARCYRLNHLGAIAPGFQADLVVLNDLEQVSIDSVYYKGKKISANTPAPKKPCPEPLKHTVHLSPVTAEHLQLKVNPEKTPVLEMIPGQITTKMRVEKIPQENGIFIPDSIYNKAVVIERHRASGRVGIVPVKGFGVKHGAIATTVAHDSHNLIVIGDNDADILTAIQELERVQGGYTVVRHGQIAGTLPLPIMGLMSDAGFEQVNTILSQMIFDAHQMGVPADMDPFITLSFIALPVIPEIRVTTRGILDVVNQVFLT